MKKIIKTYLKDKGFKTLEDQETDTTLIAYNAITNFVIDYKENGVTVIAVKDKNDIRFVGKINNLQQLKLILELTNI